MLLTGLSKAEAVQKLSVEGPNELATNRKNKFFKILVDIIKEPMFLLLLSCAVLYLILGDLQEGVLIFSSIIIVISISFYQNWRTEKALQALRDLSTPLAFVIREGEKQKIASREIVTEDLIIVSEGDRVPADALLLTSMNFSVDESLLTGESVPVRKDDIDLENTESNLGSVPSIFSGTLVVQGKATAKVTATGINTQIGKIGKSLENITPKKTGLQTEIDVFIKRITAVGIAICVLIIVLYALERHNFLSGILVGLSASMSILPEEFPVVFTIFMALGAWRIAQKNVVTRNPSAIEALGAATVLCADKTGTITQNKMQVSCLFSPDSFHDVDLLGQTPIPETYHQVIEYGVLASHADPFDPMEKAILESCLAKLGGTEHFHKDWMPVQEYELSSKLLAMSRVYKSADEKYLVAVKGAPEAVFDLCHLGKDEQERYSKAVLEMAGKGLRVLAVAHAVFSAATLPEHQHDFNFQFCGLIGLSDPIRPEITDAIKQCDTAGIRVIMITGDYPATAQNIGAQIGLKNAEEVLTGQNMNSLTPEELAEKMKTVNIFARIVPEQKLQIVEILKANGEIVAMTGDGVNDAPALKGADIGIAMGKRGTDVAREASALVLLDDNFASIVTAVRLGRRIFDNIQKAWSYVLAIHIPIIGLVFLPVFMSNIPLILMPAHIVFLELIIDPVSSIVFENEPEEADIMRRSPRSKKHKFFSKKRILISLSQGLSILVVTICVYFLAAKLQFTEGQVRTITFFTLVFSNVIMVLSHLSEKKSFLYILRRPGVSTILILGGALALLSIILIVPALRNVFHLELFPLKYFSVVLVASFTSISWFEILKMRKRNTEELVK